MPGRRTIIGKVTIVKSITVLWLLSAVLMLTPLIQASAQTQVSIGASKDNTLYQDSTGSLSNGAGQHIFVGRTSSNLIRRALVAFNIAGNIPAGSHVLSATLTLNVSQTSSGADSVRLFRVLANWGEGTSVAPGNEGGGTLATTNDATWTYRFYNTQLWSQAGSDHSSTESAAIQVSALGSYVWGSTDGMVADVQQWLDTPATNFGWLLMGDEAAPHLTKRFDSRQDTVASVRPLLTVTYTPPSSVNPEGSTPSTFALDQNYPNPFNPATEVRFVIGEGGFVSLKVYNILGKEVATLVSGVMAAGSHEVTFTATNADGSPLASGMYFYQLRANGLTATKRMMLVR